MNEKQSLKLLHVGISDLFLCCCNILFEAPFQVFWIQKKRLSQLRMSVARCSKVSFESHLEAEHLTKSLNHLCSDKSRMDIFRNFLLHFCTVCSTLAVTIKNVLAFISIVSQLLVNRFCIQAMVTFMCSTMTL